MPMVQKRRKIKKFFLNVEKKCKIQGQIQKIIVNEKEISDEKRINAVIELFYKNVFKKMYRKILLST